MFYYINLGAAATVGAGTLTVGGGSYVVWHFKDTIVSTVSQNVSPDPNTNTQQTNLSKEFNQHLQEAQDNQSHLADAEAKLEELKSEKTIAEGYLEVIKTEITNITTDLEKWTDLEKNSADVVNNLKKKKDENASVVSQKGKEHQSEKEKLEALKRSTNTINEQSISEQAATNAAFEAKIVAEESLENISEGLKTKIKELDKITIFVTQLTTQEVLKKTDFDNKTTADKANMQAITDQITSIKQKIDNNIQQIDQELTQVTSKIDGFIKEITALKAAETQAQQDIVNLDTDSHYQQVTIDDSDPQKTQKQQTNTEKLRQKQEKKQELQQKQNQSNADWEKKEREKTEQENTKNTKQTTRTKWNNCKSNADQYASATFQNTDCSWVIKDDIEVLAGLHTKKKQSADALSLSTTEHAGIKEKLLSAKADETKKRGEKDQLESEKSKVETTIATLTNDYDVKKAKSDKERQAKANGDNEIEQQTLVVAKKQQDYEDVQKEQQKIISHIVEAEKKQQELKDTKTSLLAKLNVKNQSQTQQSQALEEKIKEVTQQIEVINNQRK